MDLSWLFWVFLIFAAVGRIRQFMEQQRKAGTGRYSGPVSDPWPQRRSDAAGRRSGPGELGRPNPAQQWQYEEQERQQGPADISVADVAGSAAGVAAEADRLTAEAETRAGAGDVGRTGLTTIGDPPEIGSQPETKGFDSEAGGAADGAAVRLPALTTGDLAYAMVMSEVLGPPRAQRPYRCSLRAHPRQARR